MVVDGDPSTARHVTQWLEDAGFRVEVFGDHRACLAALADAAPLAICLTLVAAEPQGVDSIGRIHELDADLPVLALMRGAWSANGSRAVASGAYDYLTEPVDAGKLVTQVRNCIDHYKLALRVRELERQLVAGGGTPAPPQEFESLEELEKRAILDTMHRTGGNVSEAVRRLGIGRTTLYRKLRKYKLR